MLNGEKGFSLVEVLVALVILTVAVFPIVNYFTNSISIVHQSETMSQAADIAVDVMEILKTGDIDTGTLYIDMSNFTSTDSLEIEIYDHISRYDQFADYEVSIDLEKAKNTSGLFDDLISADIIVSWRDNDFKLSSVIRGG